jgi:heme oxygenase (biliverdin-IX-beta and delta-forming)
MGRPVNEFSPAPLAAESIGNARVLSAHLRTETASLHRQIELLLGLPGAIRSRDDYVLWLGRYLGIYEPLERLLAAFSDWDALGIPRPLNHTVCLLDDLTAIGADSGAARRMQPPQLPDLPAFAFAFGASYVLEGATLGGRVILRDLQTRIGAPIVTATRFFGGAGDGPTWLTFKSTLDGFGCAQPKRQNDVLSGAQRTFGAMLAWFAPICTDALRRS